MVKIGIIDLFVVEQRGLAPHEVTRILRLVERNRGIFLEAWHDYFGD